MSTCNVCGRDEAEFGCLHEDQAPPLRRVSLSCDECPPDSGSRLHVTVSGRRYCAKHWYAAGCPTPREPLATAQQVHEQELATRDRMNRRGGTDRHMVRTGRT